jgi:oligopeptide transport system substrate-binding protein
MRRRSSLAALTVLALLVSACGPQAPAAAPTATGGATAAPAATAAPKPTTPLAAATAGLGANPTPQPTQAPAGAQEITINALQGEPDNIDPNRSQFNTEAAVVRQVFEPLLTFDKDLKPIPAAATAFDVSPDGKTYTFHLRPDGKFSDGTPVLAKDFVYSFKRLLDPKTGAEYASFFTDAGIVGAKAFNEGSGSADDVGVKAVDDHTLQIDLENPVGYFPNLVALWVVPPLRQDIIDKAGTGWTQDPSTYIGNGPFKLTEWVHQDHITLAPNPNYAGTKPILQKVTFLMVDSDEADYAAYRNNERDWALVPDADVAAVRADPQLAKEAREYTELTTFWLQMNNARKPLDNVLVRRALSRAIDRQALIRDIAGGLGQPALSFIPPGMPGFQPELGKDIDFDPNAAKDLLRQAGFSEASSFPRLRFRFGSSAANQTRAEFIQAQLKQNLGIQIDLDAMEPKAYQAAVKNRDYDLGYSGWGADYPDPQDWLSGLFTCNAGNNLYNYCDPQFDQVAQRGDTQTDQNARLQAYAQAQQTLDQDVAVVPLFFRGRMVLVKPWVQNLVITAKDDYPGLTFLNQVSVARH